MIKDVLGPGNLSISGTAVGYPVERGELIAWENNYWVIGQDT
jgi:hypothetical protein